MVKVVTMLIVFSEVVVNVGGNNIVIVVMKKSTQNQESLKAELTELSNWSGVIVRKHRALK